MSSLAELAHNRHTKLGQGGGYIAAWAGAGCPERPVLYRG